MKPLASPVTRPLEMTIAFLVLLTEAGFERVDVAGKPAWREAERDLYELSIQADAAGDPAIEALQEQARRGLYQVLTRAARCTRLDNPTRRWMGREEPRGSC